MLQQNNRHLYNRSDDDELHEQVDLDDLPLLDDNGFEVNVYNAHSFRVPRRTPVNPVTCGALLNLERVHELFQGIEDAQGHVENEAPFWIYPLAYTRNLGNVKSPSIITPFNTRLKQIDHLIRPPIPENDMDLDPLQRGAPLLHGIGCQIYNSLSHRVRNEAKFHFVQLGMVTSSLAGTAMKSTPHESHWTRRVRFCDHALPHVRFNQKVADDGQPQVLRFENTYTLDVYRMAHAHRNGAYVHLIPL